MACTSTLKIQYTYIMPMNKKMKKVDLMIIDG